MEVTSKQIKKILDSTFWLETLSSTTTYRRIHDDHDGYREGVLSLGIDRQGDVWLTTDKHVYPPMRFRTWAGGGISLRTRNALLILAEAIRLDNEDHPQDLKSLEIREVESK